MVSFKKTRNLVLLPLLFFVVACDANQSPFEVADLVYEEFESLNQGVDPVVIPGDSFRLGTWNMQVFGDSKASNPEKFPVIIDIIEGFDIIALQEIRDKDGSSIDVLCTALPDHDCLVSSRAGSTQMKEQYIIAYKSEFEYLGSRDYYPELSSVLERPPFLARFSWQGVNFSVVTVHTDPDIVAPELAVLDDIFNGYMENIFLVGDLNSDCDYYNLPGNKLTDFKWHVDFDTTSSATDCSYDQILTSKNNKFGISEAGAVIINKSISDHYPVYAEVGLI